MLINKTLAVAAILLFLPNVVVAKEKCDDPQTQTDMNICSDLSYKKADKQLNKTYQKALKIDNSDKFKEIQRAWLKFRDLNCKYQSDGYKGGTIAPLVYAKCMERLTNERSKEIPYFFNEWEFDEWEGKR